MGQDSVGPMEWGPRTLESESVIVDTTVLAPIPSPVSGQSQLCPLQPLSVSDWVTSSSCCAWDFLSDCK